MQFYDEKYFKEIADIIRNNGIVAFPTETVYGLGVLASKKECFDLLVKIKKRNPDKPFTLMCSRIEQIRNYIDIDERTLKIINKFMPGELTIIVKTKIDVPEYFDLKTGYIGLRIPNKKFVLDLIDEINEPLFVTSCNLSGTEPAKNDEEVYKIFNDNLDAIVKGNCENGVPSTIIKIDNDIKLIREGKITLEEIMEALR